MGEGTTTKEATSPLVRSAHAIIALTQSKLVNAMLTSLEIQNFMGIKQGKLDDLAQVNILVGRNNSGKSTILDALVMLRCAVVGRDYLDRLGIEQILRRRVDQGGSDLSYDELWFEMATANPIRFEATFGTGLRVTEQWDRQENRLRATAELHRPEKSSAIHRWNSRGDLGHANNYENVDNWNQIKGQAGETHATFIALINLLEPGLIRHGFDEAFWYQITKGRREREVIKMLNEIYQTNIEHLSYTMFPPPQRRLVAALRQNSVAVDWFGDGLRYAVNILSFGVVLHGTALLVEELETHQHPESLNKLTETLFELAKQHDLQLFLTTHSMELITYALEAAEKSGIDLRLHHLRLDQEGTLTSIPFTRPNADLMLDLGHDPRLHYKYISAE